MSATSRIQLTSIELLRRQLSLLLQTHGVVRSARDHPGSRGQQREWALAREAAEEEAGLQRARNAVGLVCLGDCPHPALARLESPAQGFCCHWSRLPGLTSTLCSDSSPTSAAPVSLSPTARHSPPTLFFITHQLVRPLLSSFLVLSLIPKYSTWFSGQFDIYNTLTVASKVEIVSSSYSQKQRYLILVEHLTLQESEKRHWGCKSSPPQQLPTEVHSCTATL